MLRGTEPQPSTPAFCVCVYSRANPFEDKAICRSMVYAARAWLVPRKINMKVHAPSVVRMLGLLHCCAPIRCFVLLLPLFCPIQEGSPQTGVCGKGKAIEGQHKCLCSQSKWFATPFKQTVVAIHRLFPTRELYISIGILHFLFSRRLSIEQYMRYKTECFASGFNLRAAFLRVYFSLLNSHTGVGVSTALALNARVRNNND